MAIKKEVNYFSTFVELASYSCEASELLIDIIKNFDPDSLLKKMDEMHKIEHAGDDARHVMIRKLLKEFITPIEREDIVALADSIDNVTDTIEDVLMRIYMSNTRSMRPDALKMCEIIAKCCIALKEALEEFQNFRKSNKLHGLIVEINRLEEEGDRLFTQATRRLYEQEKDPVAVFGWDHILHYMEKCCDACEGVADVIEGVIMKNS